MTDRVIRYGRLHPAKNITSGPEATFEHRPDWQTDVGKAAVRLDCSILD